jgi:hypothetical protein
MGDDLFDGAVAVKKRYVWNEEAIGHNLHAQFWPHANLTGHCLLLISGIDRSLPR